MQWTKQDPYEWHRCFAWLPKRMLGTHDYVWLEYVERRWHSNNGLFAFVQYRKVAA